MTEVAPTDSQATPQAPYAPGESRIYDRYGVVSLAGFQPLPDVLLFHQSDLQLRGEDLNVLLNILAHWYHPANMPFLRISTIARRIGVSDRTVQRSIQRLRAQGFLGRGDDTRAGERFDVAPLLKKLAPYARKRVAAQAANKEVREAKEAIRNGVAQRTEPPLTTLS